MSVRIVHALAGVALTIAGCSAPPPPKGQYPITPKEALHRLEKADIIGFRNARQCGMLIHFSPLFPDHDSFGWTVTSSGEEVAKFWVTVSPTATGTQTTIVVPKAANGG
jgi:hypothetical protein